MKCPRCGDHVDISGICDSCACEVSWSDGDEWGEVQDY